MKRSIIVAIIVAAIAVPAGAYAAYPLFVNTVVNEPPPVTASDDKMMEDKSDAAIAGKDGDAMMEDKETTGESTMMEKDEDSMMEGKGEDAMMEEKQPLAGNFAGAGDGFHNAEGVASVIYLEDGSSVLRFEDFRVTNGPDLYVYLATDKQASDFVDLGLLKGNVGSQNYNIPEGTDLSKYDTVVIWCKSFSVYFGGAELTTMSA